MIQPTLQAKIVSMIKIWRQSQTTWWPSRWRSCPQLSIVRATFLVCGISSILATSPAQVRAPIYVKSGVFVKSIMLKTEQTTGGNSNLFLIGTTGSLTSRYSFFFSTYAYMKSLERSARARFHPGERLFVTFPPPWEETS